MSEKRAGAPEDKHDFIATVIQGDNPPETSVVLMNPTVNSLGINWDSQVPKLHRHPLLSKGLSKVDVQTTNGLRPMLALRLDLFPEWIMSIDASRVRKDVREKVLAHQRAIVNGRGWANRTTETKAKPQKKERPAMNREAATEKKRVEDKQALVPVPFFFKGQEVRTLIFEKRACFVAGDVAGRLGYADANKAIRQHCKGRAIRLPLATPGGVQMVRVIERPDVLRLIARSQLAEAQKFEAWIFEEVLPAIFDTGSYVAPGATGAMDNLGPNSRAVVGGIVKSVVGKEIAEAKAEIKADLDRAVTEAVAKAGGTADYHLYRSMLTFLMGKGVAADQKRRILAHRCALSIRRWCAANNRGEWFRLYDQEMPPVYRYHTMALDGWWADLGAAMTRDHLAKLGRQSVLTLVGGKGRKHHESRPHA